ncbi:hypothetical protein ACFUJY_32005 [Streptomyces sp. NPDC057249]|uniref:hypothetical protein n=1 Tax=Streptomyces sp. NPDC057249 TaxID=3346067 RepID=UPI00363D055B
MLGALLPVLLLAPGCGIRATDVVEAGEPATVEVAPAGQRGALLYFVSSSSAARLLPVVRTVSPPEDGEGGAWADDTRPSGASAALYLLFEGPTRAEHDAGLRTELPSGRVRAAVELSAEGVKATVDMPVTKLSQAARQQLICTAATASTADRTEVVTVTGTDGAIGPTHCSV